MSVTKIDEIGVAGADLAAWDEPTQLVDLKIEDGKKNYLLL